MVHSSCFFFSFLASAACRMGEAGVAVTRVHLSDCGSELLRRTASAATPWLSPAGSSFPQWREVRRVRGSSTAVASGAEAPAALFGVCSASHGHGVNGSFSCYGSALLIYRPHVSILISLFFSALVLPRRNVGKCNCSLASAFWFRSTVSLRSITLKVWRWAHAFLDFFCYLMTFVFMWRGRAVAPHSGGRRGVEAFFVVFSTLLLSVAARPMPSWSHHNYFFFWLLDRCVLLG